MTIQGVLLDIDGVLTEQWKAIEGAAEALAFLRERKLPFRLVTNTTSRSRRILAGALGEEGLDVDEGSILNPMVAARRWLELQGRTPVALFVPEAAHGEFESLDVLGPGDPRPAKAVVIGDLGHGWDYETMNRVLRRLMESENCVLVTLGRTRYWRAPRGWALDVGAFAAAFEFASDRKALVMGKPAEEFYHFACHELGVDPGATLMVGDDVRSDVGAALDAGLHALLVRTGKFREGDLDEGIRPDAVLNSIADLKTWLEQ